jgi:hypothetical protein
LLADVVWDTAVSHTSYTFDQPYPQLYWRVLLTPDPLTGLTEPVASSVHAPLALTRRRQNRPLMGCMKCGTAVTSSPGAVRMTYLVWPATTSTTARWRNGMDPLADGHHRHGRHFNPPQPGQHYAFRSQAIDRAGNVEPPHSQPDITTEQAILLPHAIMLPIVQK